MTIRVATRPGYDIGPDPTQSGKSSEGPKIELAWNPCGSDTAGRGGIRSTEGNGARPWPNTGWVQEAGTGMTAVSGRGAQSTHI